MSVQPFSGPIPALVRDFLKTKVRIDKLHVKNEGGEWVEKRGPFIKGNMLKEESSGLTVIDRASGEKRKLNSFQEIRKEHFRWWRVIVMEFDAEDTLLAQREALSKLPIPPTFAVFSGNKSIHAYWILKEPIPWVKGEPTLPCVLSVFQYLDREYPELKPDDKMLTPNQWSRGDSETQYVVDVGTGRAVTPEEVVEAFGEPVRGRESRRGSFATLSVEEEEVAVVLGMVAEDNPRWLPRFRDNQPFWSNLRWCLVDRFGEESAKGLLGRFTNDQKLIDECADFDPNRADKVLWKTHWAKLVAPFIARRKFQDLGILVEKHYPCRYNELTKQIEKLDGREYRDHDSLYLDARKREFQVRTSAVGKTPSYKYPRKEEFRDAFVAHAKANSFYPPAEYLEEVKRRYQGGDLKPERIDNVASRFLCARPDRLADRIMEVMLVAMVRRIQEPGTKFHLVPVLKGKQNFGKSNFLETLASSPWFTDSAVLSPGSYGARDNLMAMHRSVIAEFGELQTRKSEQNEMKRLITSSVDVFREPYERAERPHPRRFIACATTNNEEFLADETGSRRFGVINVTRDMSGETERAEITAARDGLWLGALLAVENGAQCWLAKKELAASQKRNKDFAVSSPYLEKVRAILTAHASDYIALDEVYRILDIPEDRQERAKKAVTGALRELDWEPKRLRIDGPQKRYWVREDSPLAKGVEDPFDISDYV